MPMSSDIQQFLLIGCRIKVMAQFNNNQIPSILPEDLNTARI